MTTDNTLDGEWRPIESFPQDGSEALVWEEGGNCDFARWHHDHVCGEREGWSRFTHWMPLPSPPKEEME